MFRPDVTLPDTLMAQFLSWLATTPRTYAEVLKIWRSRCPQMLIWEDALAADLIAIERLTGKDYQRATVALTPRGRLLLEAILASRLSSLNGDSSDRDLRQRRNSIPRP